MAGEEIKAWQVIVVVLVVIVFFVIKGLGGRRWQ